MVRSNVVRILLSLTFTLAISYSAHAQQSSGTLAHVNGDTITTTDLEQKEGNRLLQARYQYYQVEKKALDELIEQHLLETEAHRQGMTVDQLFQREIDSKVKDPSEDQLQVYYEGLDGKEPYDKVRDKIRDHIREIRASKLRTAYIESLRSKANIMVELAPPLADVDTENAAAIEGPRDAPVQLVEFADYQCPYCQKVNQDLVKLLEEYKGNVAVIYKDFPLPMHPHAEKAAEAARCAAVGGRVIVAGLKHGASSPLPTDVLVRREIEVRGVAARQSWAIDAALAWLSRDPALFGAFSSVTVGLADVERALLALGGEAGGPRPVHAVVRPNGG